MVLSPLSFRYPVAQTKQSSAVVPVHVLQAAWQPENNKKPEGWAGQELEMNYNTLTLKPSVIQMRRFNIRMKTKS